jgi:nucleoside-diphosphate-sugar epimerase
MKIFITGASGYIGGSVAAGLLAAGHEVSGLARSRERATQLAEFGIEPVLGTLADADLLARAARASDAVINAANSDDRAAVDALVTALEGSDKPLLHTSGSSIVADLAAGEPGNAIYAEDTSVRALPGRAVRAALNQRVRDAAKQGVRAVVICPSLIYGRGLGVKPDSAQVPRLIELARKYRVGRHVGRGENIWSNVHIDDLVELYALALERAPAGAFYYAENGENSMREAASAISHMLGYGARTVPLSPEEAVAELGEVSAAYTYGSNSRVRAVRARSELGWSPRRRALLDDIGHGSYAPPAAGGA